MKHAVRMCLVCLLLGACSAWANVTGSTNPNLFLNTVDWCAQAAFSCGGGTSASYQPFTASNGDTGSVGMFTGANFQVLQEGSTSFGGGFPDGMGLIYNGVSTVGNDPGYIAMFFDKPQWGAGAYIQPYWYGPFTAAVGLFDVNFNLIGSYAVNGNSTDQPSDLVFIGARDTNKDVGAVLFLTFGLAHDGDFAIGMAGLATPEPSSLLLMAPSMLGLMGIVRRRLTLKSQKGVL